MSFFAASCAGRLQNRSQWHRRNRQRRRYLLFLFKVFKKTYDICIEHMTKLWKVPLISAKRNKKKLAITICLRLRCTHFTFYLENIWQTLFYFVRNVDLGGQWMYFHFVFEKTMVLSFLVAGHPWIFVTKCPETCKNSPIWRICSPVSYMASKM